MICSLLCFNRKVQFIIDRSGGSIESCNLSLSVPENSVDREVHLNIRTTEVRKVPPIAFEFGERALSGILELEPIGIQFKLPATLTVRHSVVELPELSSIVLKFYNHEVEKWITLPRDAGWF